MVDGYDIYFQLSEHVGSDAAKLLMLIWIIAVGLAAISALLGAVAAIAYLIAGSRISEKRGEVKP